MKQFYIRWMVLFYLLCFCLIPYATADTVTYKYDNAGRLTEAKYGSKVIKYTYDAAGNLLSRVIQAGLPDTVNPTGTGTDLPQFPRLIPPLP